MKEKQNLRILVVSNLYPPHHIGGYELACAEVVDALRRRGHRITVLTSMRGMRRPAMSAGVVRVLHVHFHIDPPYARRFIEAIWSLWNRLILRTAVKLLRPDVVHVFNPMGLGASALDWLHGQSVPVVHDVSDTWLTQVYGGDYWFQTRRYRSRSLLKRIAKSLLVAVASPLLGSRPHHVDLRRSYFRSKYLRQAMIDAGMAVCGAPVIYHGIRLDELPLPAFASDRGGIVFAGRLSPDKGVHIFLHALGLLAHATEVHGLHVTIIGPVVDPAYYQTLCDIAAKISPHVQIHFIGHVSRQETMKIIGEHSVFAFPAIWDEPFSIVLLEALAMEAAVVATATGGSGEILTHERNALIVERDNAEQLAAAIHRLLLDANLRERLARAARDTMKHFTFEHTIDAIEGHLHHVLSSVKADRFSRDA